MVKRDIAMAACTTSLGAGVVIGLPVAGAALVERFENLNSGYILAIVLGATLLSVMFVQIPTPPSEPR